MSPHHNPAASLAALLRDACRRALALGVSFTNQIRLYRSIVALAREVRLRAGGIIFDTSSLTLSALLAAVCGRASELGADAELPLPDAILLHRLAVQLSRAARRAGATEPADRQFAAKNPLHREEPAQPEPAEAAKLSNRDVCEENLLHREESAQLHPAEAAEPANRDVSEKNPMHREDDAADGRLTA